jgi:hypothetical protein
MQSAALSESSVPGTFDGTAAVVVVVVVVVDRQQYRVYSGSSAVASTCLL